MKKKTRAKAIMASIMAAIVIAAAPAAYLVPATLTATAATVFEIPTDMKKVEKKGSITVTVPEKVSSSFQVKAYQMLQLVIHKESTFTADKMSTVGVYVVTDPFKEFFETAKTAYTAQDSPLYTANTLYLTYNTASESLELSSDLPSGSAGEDYIVIDNKAHTESAGHVEDVGKLDKTYFEADLVSRISSSNPVSDETKASDARLLSDWASRYIKANSSSISYDAVATAEARGSSSVFELKDLVYGYYVILTNDDSTDGDGSVINQSILNVPTAEKVTLKATPITVDKSVTNLIDANLNNNNAANKKNDSTTRIDDDTTDGTKYDRITANIGDTLQYSVESHIPSLTSYALDDTTKLLNITSGSLTLDSSNFDSQITNKFVYTFRDTMVNQEFGATSFEMVCDEKTYVVKQDSDKYYIVQDNVFSEFENNAIGRIWVTPYDESSKKSFFAVAFDLKKLKAAGLDGKDVVFTYNAELMGEAGNADSRNTAAFTYSNDPFDSSTNDTISDSDNVYTYDVKVDKIFSDGATTEHYRDVSFKLYSDSEHSHTIKFVKKSDGSYVRSDSNDSGTTDELAINPSDGTLQLHGLGEGTYYLLEQENPNLSNAGYNVEDQIVIVISAKSTGGITDSRNFDLFNGNSTAASAKIDETGVTLRKTASEYGIEFDVINQKGFRLPVTGEFGSWYPYYSSEWYCNRACKQKEEG